MQNRAGKPVGTINSWSLTFTPAPPAASAAGAKVTGAPAPAAPVTMLPQRTLTGDPPSTRAADLVFAALSNPDGVRE